MNRSAVVPLPTPIDRAIDDMVDRRTRDRRLQLILSHVVSSATTDFTRHPERSKSLAPGLPPGRKMIAS